MSDSSATLRELIHGFGRSLYRLCGDVLHAGDTFSLQQGDVRTRHLVTGREGNRLTSRMLLVPDYKSAPEPKVLIEAKESVVGGWELKTLTGTKNLTPPRVVAEGAGGRGGVTYIGKKPTSMARLAVDDDLAKAIIRNCHSGDKPKDVRCIVGNKVFLLDRWELNGEDVIDLHWRSAEELTREWTIPLRVRLRLRWVRLKKQLS